MAAALIVGSSVFIGSANAQTPPQIATPTPTTDSVVPSVSFPSASGSASTATPSPTSAPAAATASASAAATGKPTPTPKPRGIQQIKTTDPIKDLRIPSFDKDGKRTTFIRADEAMIISQNQIDVKNLHFTLFTKDGSGSFDTVLLAPSATLIRDKEFVSGQESVRLLRADVEVTGEQWSFDKPAQRVIINKNAKVIFQEELKSVIK